MANGSVAGLPIVLLADDLTGALDCAAVFVRAGFTAYVSVDGEVDTPPGHSVISINANTRRLDAAQAVRVIRTATRGIAQSGASLRYVKIDSTLRGHPGLEIGISAEATGVSLALVAPSFPGAGRVVRDGEDDGDEDERGRRGSDGNDD
ncbi:MAG: hypothetical protein O3B04_09935 [Chloroflexi bacterium]|nr:hypothetical protein [Chloroflexota bacterium]